MSGANYVSLKLSSLHNIAIKTLFLSVRMEGWALRGYRMQLGEGEYQFPDLCAVLHEDSNCSAAHNMTVGLQTINWPTLLYVSGRRNTDCDVLEL